MVNFLVNAFDIFVQFVIILVVIRVLLSWFNIENGFKNLLFELTEPVIFPVRKILPQGSMLDFSPIVTILLLEGLQYLIHYLANIPY